MTSVLAPVPAAPVASSSAADPAAPVASSSAADPFTESESAAPAASASHFEVDLPVVSSIACVQFYGDSLTTKQRCGLRKHAGSIWRVGTACSGTDSVVKVLEHLGRCSGWAFTHAFSCERDEAK